MEWISQKEAKKLVLHSQWLPSKSIPGSALDATFACIDHLGYVQIDTISVVERAHHHTLWNRNPRYRHSHIDTLQAKRKIFEYWSHAAAYLPMSDYRYSLRKMREVANSPGHWFDRDSAMMKAVLQRIVSEGPLQSRDFEHKTGTRRDMWDWKPAKRALEQLFMEGRLMTLRREGFQKVYDLTENVLPAGIDTSEPSESEWARYLVNRFLKAHGIGKLNEMTYLRKGTKHLIESVLAEMCEEGSVSPINISKGRRVVDKDYFTSTEYLELLAKPLMRKRVKILSPFDNLLIQRNRMKQLFDFDYQIECYVPQAKRVHGYFCLPLLWDAALVGRVDCKADRPTRTMLIQSLTLEKDIKDMDTFVYQLVKTLSEFCSFNQCDEISFRNIRNADLIRKMETARMEILS
ncbi:MAG: hypothetical protein GKR95_02850 [Gammaproteobacteria bacterium]|nr:hypothetical protein [Gammaproteobacteria bacterium]NKB61110.1 hypothetical protein [Gammaproteobacteria bacterium]